MNRHFACRVALVCWMMFWIANSSVAQQPVTGLPPLGSFAGGPFDTVNLANLDVHFSIPVFGRAGKGIPFSYSLSYDSLVWGPVASDGASVWTPVNSNWGWRAVTEAATGYVTFGIVNGPTSSCLYGHENGFPLYGTSTVIYENLYYHDPSGGIHPFPGEVKSVSVTNTACGTIGVTVYPVTNALTTDNSGYIVNTNTSTALGPVTVNARGGLKIVTPNLGSPTGAGSITDANGNQISISSTGVITDTLGTTALTVSGNAPTNSSCTPAVTYKYTAPSGATATVTVNYQQYTVQTYFLVSGITEFPATSECLVNTIVLSDATEYQFSYESTNFGGGSSGETTGRIASVTLPTGGTINYVYHGACTNSYNCMMADGSPLAMTDSLASGPQTWNYTRAVQPGQQLPQTVTTITDAANNQTTMNFSGVYNTSSQVYSGGLSGGTLEDYSYICYNGDANHNNDCLAAVVTPPITWTSRNDALNTQLAMWSGIQDYYDVYGNVTQELDYDYASSNHPLLRIVNITENSALCSGSKHICDHPASVQITDGSSHQEALTNYTYDNGSNTNGNLTQAQVWVSGTSYLNSNYTYNGGGTLATAQDPNGTTTTYSYNGACNSAFPTSVSVPSDAGGNLVTNYTYNCTGGVVTSVSDPNNAVTSIGYTKDPYFWRPESTTDALGNITYYNYYGVPNNPGGSVVSKVGQVESVMNFGTSTVDTLSTPETYGRPFLQQKREGPGSGSWDSVEVAYDGSNRVEYSYLPFVSTAGGSGGSAHVTYSYDPLGRPLLVTDAAGGTNTYYYSMNDVQVTRGPAPTESRQLQYDVLGRTTSVCELLPNGGGSACGQNYNQGTNGFVTLYTYDPLGDLATVNQSNQSRSFFYDGLRRMTSESNPESGTTTYTYDSVAASYCALTSAYSSPGDLVAKADANGNHVCSYYDALHRLTAVGNNNQSASNPCLRFSYDNSTGVQHSIPAGVSVANTLGRVEEAETDSCSTPITPITDEWFSYSSRGENTNLYELFSGATIAYHVQQSYFANGAMASLQGFTGTGTTTPLSDLFSYNLDGEGRPYGMVDTTRSNQTIWQSTTYNTASQPLVVTIPGGVESFQYDPNSGRMTNWTSDAGSNQQVGSLYWNANGTLQQLQINDTANLANTQTCAYTYDDLMRVASVKCGNGMWGQTFGYDAFGNIATNIPNGYTGFAFQATYASNNRIQNLGFQYDSVGDVTADNLGNQYTYDARGRPVTAAGVTTTFDAFGRAVEQNRSGTNTQIVYGPSGAKFAFMNGSTLIEYIDPMVAGMAAIHNGNGTGYFQHADWLGSSRFAQDGGGNVIYDRAYAPFGEPYDEYNNVTTNRNFTGQTEDTTPGLYDFLFRQESQTQGRWLVPDPAGLAAVDITNPQTWNRYAYVANNPLNATDPLGLYCSVDDSDTIGECGDDWFDDFAIFCCTGGGGGVDHRGGGGGGGGQPPPQQPINFPNETNGLPNGFPTNSWGVWGSLIPTADCGDITCLPESFADSNPMAVGGPILPPQWLLNLVALFGTVGNNATNAAPLKVNSGVCSIYGNQPYAGAGLQCVCRAAGDSPWSQDTRGCLAADQNAGVPEWLGHGTCYAGSTIKQKTLPVTQIPKWYMSCKTW